MVTLDLYKKRRFNTIKLSDGIEYKIPNEYSVEEVERLLELKIKQEELSSVEAGETKEEQQENVNVFYSNIFDQIEVIFQQYQPEIDKSYLQKHVTHKEALEIVGFFQEYRALALGNNVDQDLKKKLKN